MSDDYEFPKSGINKFVALELASRQDLKNKVVLDCPAGDGRTSHLLMTKGAQVTSADLFPEFFKPKNMKCDDVDIAKGLPYPDDHFDIIVCQEGIEHFPDQYSVLKEFSRVLKKGGELLMTTPNISHLRAKLSYLFTESEYYKRSAPSELDGVWFSDKNKSEIYFGHVFLINNQKLRTLGVLSGFEILKSHKTQVGVTSVLFLPLFYPFVLIVSLMPFLFYSKKLPNISRQFKNKVMWEQLKLNVSLKTLICKHTMISFVKKRDEQENLAYLKNITRKESWN